jgi:hypothetical protein
MHPPPAPGPAALPVHLYPTRPIPHSQLGARHDNAPPPGRPREFKYKMRQEVIHHVHHGATVEEAARIVGISLRTVQRAAKGDDDFHHDLHLALNHSQIDPEKLVQKAARTHWRAAAWLLERTRPHEFAKRPPNSCSPETLQDMNDWLIETALEATPPEHREAVYRRMRNVADKAFDILMPDQHEERRRLVGSLPQRDMPLSAQEWGKTLEVVRRDANELDGIAPDRNAPVPSPERGGLGSGLLRSKPL